jgi:taurine dioxygenase
MKKLLAGLYGVHMQGSVQFGGAGWIRTAPAASHPVVRVHPDSGRKVLYVNETVRLFVGMTADESQPLIRYLTGHAVRPQNVYRHRWHKDDLVISDNRSVLHMALADYDRTRVRHMERTTVNAAPSGYAYEGPLA